MKLMGNNFVKQFELPGKKGTMLEQSVIIIIM